MKASVHLYLLCISLLLALPISVQAQTTFPSADGERAKYAAYIEMPKAYVSGICVLLQEDGLIKGSLFNEFGITALDFTYNPQRDKIKLHSVIKMMDKWYIRKVLKKDPPSGDEDPEGRTNGIYKPATTYRLQISWN